MLSVLLSGISGRKPKRDRNDQPPVGCSVHTKNQINKNKTHPATAARRKELEKKKRTPSSRESGRGPTPTRLPGQLFDHLLQLFVEVVQPRLRLVRIVRRPLCRHRAPQTAVWTTGSRTRVRLPVGNSTRPDTSYGRRGLVARAFRRV